VSLEAKVEVGAAEMLRLPESAVVMAIAQDFAVAAGPHSTWLSLLSLVVVALAEVLLTGAKALALR
jgi:hypothetical protein